MTKMGFIEGLNISSQIDAEQCVLNPDCSLATEQTDEVLFAFSEARKLLRTQQDSLVA